MESHSYEFVTDREAELHYLPSVYDHQDDAQMSFLEYLLQPIYELDKQHKR